jgi:hypothetical protein
VSERALPWNTPAAAVFGPFVVPTDPGRGLGGATSVLDTRSGAFVDLGPSVSLVHAGSEYAVFRSGTGASATYREIPLASLSPVRC